MSQKIIEFFAFLPKEIYVFFISILPIIELRGAIPVGAAIGLPFYVNYPVAVLGNLLPVPFILAFIPRILEFMHSHRIFPRVVEWVWEKADKYKGKIIKEESDGTRLTKEVFLALMLFVAIPLPGTGAWTGGFVASVLTCRKDPHSSQSLSAC